MDVTGTRPTLPDTFDRFWHGKRGYVRRAVFDRLLPDIGRNTPSATIWTMVTMSKLKNETDILETFEALLAYRNLVREQHDLVANWEIIA